MRMAEAILPEFDHEMATTRKMLERFPEDKVEWRPHETCMTLGRLAGHVGELAGWVIPTMTQDKLELDPDNFTPNVIKSRAEGLKEFDETVKTARAAIAGASDDLCRGRENRVHDAESRGVSFVCHESFDSPSRATGGVLPYRRRAGTFDLRTQQG